MRVRIIAKFKNEDFFQARVEAGLTQRELGKLCGLGENGGQRVNQFENFQGYPKRDGRSINRADLIANLEETLKRPYDMLFPKEYRDAIDKKLGRPIHGVLEFKELPEWQERNLMLPSPEISYDTVELKELIRKALYRLTKREKIVVEQRYGLDGNGTRTYEEIAKTLCVTRERIRQIEHKAMRTLCRLQEGLFESLRAFWEKK